MRKCLTVWNINFFGTFEEGTVRKMVKLKLALEK